MALTSSFLEMIFTTIPNATINIKYMPCNNLLFFTFSLSLKLILATKL